MYFDRNTMNTDQFLFDAVNFKSSRNQTYLLLYIVIKCTFFINSAQYLWTLVKWSS